MEDPRSVVAELLYKWALQEMKYQPQGRYANTAPPSLHEIKKLCRGNTLKFWEYVYQRVRSEKTIEMVRKNLELNEKQTQKGSETIKQEERLKALKAKRDALLAQVSSTQSKISKMQAQTENIHKEIAVAQTSQLSVQQKLEEHEIKTHLTDAYDKKMAEISLVLQEYRSRLTEKLEHFKSRVPRSDIGKVCPESNLEPSRDNSNYKLNGSTVEEEQHELKSIAESCERIRRYLHEKMIQSYVDPASIQFSTELENSIKTALTNDKAGNLLERISALTQSETKKLAQEVDNMDMSEIQAQVLAHLEDQLIGKSNFQAYDSSNLSNPMMSTRTSSFPTVEELLDKQRQAHVANYMAAEKFFNQAHSLSKQRQQLLATRPAHNINANSGFGDENDSNSMKSISTSVSKNELIATLQDLEDQLSSAEAAYEASKLRIDQITTQKTAISEDLSELREKYQRIEELDSQNKNGQAIIQELQRQNSVARKTLEHQIRTIRGYMTSKLLTQREIQKDVNQDETRLQGKLLLTELSALLQSHMTTNSKLDDEMMSNLSEVISSLNLSPYQTPEGLLAVLYKLVLDLQKDEDKLHSRRNIMKEHEQNVSQWNDEAALTKIEQKSRQVEQIHTSTWAPILEGLVSNINKAISQCSSVQQQSNEYANQPAQFYCPWVKIDGKSYQDTLAEWKSLVHDLQS